MARTALVTGGTKGIGREIVRLLCERGFQVFTTGRSKVDLDNVIKETGCQGCLASLEDADAVLRLYEEAAKALGHIDVLVNNAGTSNNNQKIALVDETVENLNHQMAVNLRAPFILCREALKEMGQRRSGHIVNVISTAALGKQEYFGVYAASKYAFMGLNGALVKEGRAVNVKVTAVYPGGANTNIRPVARPEYMSPRSAATMVVQCIEAPDDVYVDEIVFRPGVEKNF